MKIVVFALEANVARLEEALWCDRVLGSFFVPPVPLEDIGTLDPKLARLARLHFFAVFGDVHGGHIGEELAD